MKKESFSVADNNEDIGDEFEGKVNIASIKS